MHEDVDWVIVHPDYREEWWYVNSDDWVRV